MAHSSRPDSRDDFEIAIICALPIERDAVEALLDEEYEIDGFSYGKAAGDSNAYTTGRLGNQHVVLAYMPSMGMISAAAVAANIPSSFERIKVGIVVGICGGVPTSADGVEILLGDVVISTSVIQIDFGRQHPNKFIRKNAVEDTLGRANPEIRAVVGKASGYLVRGRLKEKASLFSAQICTRDGFEKSAYPGPENDTLYPSDYLHKHRTQSSCIICDGCQNQDDEVCESALKDSCVKLGCDDKLLIERKRLQRAKGFASDGSEITTAETREAQKASIHFGRIACGNQVMKSGQHRDRIAAEEGVIGFEMESAGTWDYTPTIVIKSVCDYADSHKNKQWQEYAAATAAACTKAFLEEWRSVNRPEQSKIQLSPSPFVPFRRDRDFIDRGTLLNQILERCSTTGSRTALVGLGGVGKSQLAIEYCYRLKERSPNTWVFWVHASNIARFEQSLREIADHVQIPDRNNPQANIFQLVHDWLRDERKGNWVLILDNVDDAGFLLAQCPSQGGQSSGSNGQNSRPLLTYLPQSQNGSILITTRTRGVALKLVEETDTIAVEPMDEEHALALLKKKLGKLWEQSDGQDVAVLVAALEFMPLAIVQAAAYISQRAPRCPVRQYIDQFQRNDKGKTTLLNHEGGHLRRDREAKNSIIITWQISFDHIRQTRPSAADLLSLMSFFDRQGIPEVLLRNRRATESISGNLDSPDGEPDNEDSASELGCNDEFEEDVLTLRNYSFISANVDTTTFEMHGLVQLSMRKWLEAHEQLEGWKHQYVKILCAEFPNGEHKNWVKCQALFPHAKSVVSQQPKQGSSLRAWASILYNAAWYAYRRGNVADAEKMSIMAMRARMKMLGQDHEETLNSMGLVSLAYGLGGRWQDAAELEMQVMETTKRVLGVEHPHTLTSMGDMASIYRDQGRWQEAEELDVPVMETTKRVLGVEHPHTLASMGNLALTYGNQGRWQEAEELGLQVMETTKRVLGVEHPHTLASMGNLALTYWNQGRWQEAEELGLQVIETTKRVLGVEHPDTLTSMGDMASIYRDQGRWQEAEELDVQVMETTKRVLGVEHPYTLASMGSLALTYGNQGRWQEAEELGLQVMETTKRVLGVEHPYTLASMGNLALTYGDQGRWQEAEELGLQVMETTKRVLGVEHPYTLARMGNLASTYMNQGRLQEAEELEVQVMETGKRVLGVEHPDTLTSMGDMASIYRDQGRWQEAEELDVQVMETTKRVLGVEHPHTLASMGNLALTYGNQGRWQEAEELDVQVMETTKRVLGVEHPHTLTSVGNLALTYWNQGRWREAEELEVQVIETRKKVLGVEHPDTLTSMGNLASTYKNQGRWREAEELGWQVMETMKRVLGVEHPHTLTSMGNLASTYMNQGRWREAEKLEVQVMETMKRVLGVEHPDTLTSMGNLASTYMNQGRWREAEELEVQVMETMKRVLGVEHPSTLGSMHNLAFTWREQGRYTEAIKLMEECVRLQPQSLGVNHYLTLSSSTALTKWKMEELDIVILAAEDTEKGRG